MINYEPGDCVEVKPTEEIFDLLDENGCQDGLPFMAEMIEHCGRRHRVWRRIEKCCVEGDKVRRTRNMVLLEGMRCDGAFHGDCEKECAIIWHEAWLKPAGSDPDPVTGSVRGASFPYPGRSDDGRYICQSTRLLAASCPLAKHDLRQYWRDYAHRTWTARQMLRFVGVAIRLRARILVRGIKSVKLRGPHRRTPSAELELQPGQWVRVKSPLEISATLDSQGRNRGLLFDVFMLPCCGRCYRVRRQVRRIILETTGEMREIERTVTLEDAICDGYGRWGGCPRAAYHFWREIWLEPVEGPLNPTTNTDASCEFP